MMSLGKALVRLNPRPTYTDAAAAAADALSDQTYAAAAAGMARVAMM